MAQKKYASYATVQSIVDNIKKLFVKKTDLDTALANKADKSHNHNDLYYTESEVNTKLDAKVPTSRKINNKSLSTDITLSASDVGAAPSTHSHDDKYYTETEIDIKLAAKSDTTHKHDSDYAAKTHNHDGVYAVEGHNHDDKYDAKGSASAVQTNLNTVSDTLNAHTGNADIHFSAAERTKLSGIAAGAQVNTITGVKGNSESTYRTGNVNITKANIGLGNVDNTSDANKPISTAQQTAFDAVNNAIDTHKNNGDIHVTTANKTNWNNAYTHSTSAHARTDATKVEGSSTNGKIKINGTETTVYSHPNSGATAGTYKSVTVNAQGHVTGGSNPTTLSGFGITDGETKTDADAKLAEAKSYTDGEVAKLLNNSSEAVDSIYELRDAMQENADVVEALEQAIGTKANASDLTSHTSNTSNPHGVTKSQVGLGNVENKSSATIRGEITKSNVTTALGYTPYTPTEVDTKLSGKAGNAFSNVKVGSTTIAADTTADTLTLEGSNVTITPDTTNDKVTISVADGTTSAKGVVQLTNSTSSTSTTTAATPNSVKSAYDLANTAKTKADSAYSLADSKVDSLSDLGITATATELNYVDGVTSNIQTQLDTISDELTDHTHSASKITSGILPIERGGTGNSYGYIRAGADDGTTIGALATAEGRKVEASGDYSHAEGNYTNATGSSSHAEGQSSTASGSASHAEGNNTTASGSYSHSEGNFTNASAESAHAEGHYTLASSNYQHVQGKYNKEDKNNTYAHIVGNGTGTSTSSRSNAHTLDWNGNAWFAGDVYVGGISQNDTDASKVITKADQKWTLLYDSGEIPEIVNSISGIDVSGYTNIQVLVRVYNDGDSVGSRNGSAIFTCANGKSYQFPVWSNMFSKSINTVYTMATFNLVDGWLVCPCGSRLIGDANTFEDAEGGTAGSLVPTGSGIMKCTSPLSTLTISSLDQNSNYYFGMGSRVIVWGWN